jgi:hypothetical protein
MPEANRIVLPRPPAIVSQMAFFGTDLLVGGGTVAMAAEFQAIDFTSTAGGTNYTLASPEILIDGSAGARAVFVADIKIVTADDHDWNLGFFNIGGTKFSGLGSLLDGGTRKFVISSEMAGGSSAFFTMVPGAGWCRVLIDIVNGTSITISLTDAAGSRETQALALASSLGYNSIMMVTSAGGANRVMRVRVRDFVSTTTV